MVIKGPRLVFLRILFLTIVVIGLTVRIYNLANIPSALHVDEASIGYNAYSILTTGKDEHGVPFPIFFQAFGEYKSPIQIYSTVPLILLFGLNEFAVRLTSVIYGMLGLLVLYFLVKILLKTDKQAEPIALFSMMFLAISPWDIHFSRIAWEMMCFVFFTTFGVYLFLKAQNIPKLLPLAMVSLVMALYSYFAARIFIPLFGIGLFIIYFRFFLSHKKETLISFFILFTLLLPLLVNLTSPINLQRWQDVNIFSHPPQNQTILQHIAINYLQHFSMDFLFLKGDIGMPGQISTYDSIRGIGELYLFQLPLILIGAYYLAKKKRKEFLLVLLWLLLYPTGSMLTDSINPIARRSIIGVIPFQILSAIGIVVLLQSVSKMKKIFWLVAISLGSIITYSFIYYLPLYFIAYPNYSSDFHGFQYGSKEIVQYFATHESQYDDVVMSPYIFSPYIYFKFYEPHDCQKCKTGFPDNFYTQGRKQLFSLPPAYIATHDKFNYSPVKNIYYPNGSLAFVLTEITGEK